MASTYLKMASAPYLTWRGGRSSSDAGPRVTLRPHVSQAARDALEDLGLIDDDRVEDLRALMVVPS